MMKLAVCFLYSIVSCLNSTEANKLYFHLQFFGTDKHLAVIIVIVQDIALVLDFLIAAKGRIINYNWRYPTCLRQTGILFYNPWEYEFLINPDHKYFCNQHLWFSTEIMYHVLSTRRILSIGRWNWMLKKSDFLHVVQDFILNLCHWERKACKKDSFKKDFGIRVLDRGFRPLERDVKRKHRKHGITSTPQAIRIH